MRRIVLLDLGPVGDQDAARVLDMAGVVLAVVAEPALLPDTDVFRDAVVVGVLAARKAADNDRP